MNEQQFDAPQPEGDDHAKPEIPESATEQNEQEGDFESRYENLAHEYNSIKREREITFQVADMQSEGLQTLINEYGSDTVFNAIKKRFETKPKGDTFSTFEVVRELEPDPEKRAALFEKMKTDANQQGEKFDQWVDNPEQNEIQYDYFNITHGSAQNFSLGAKFRVDAMKALDGVLGKIAPQRHYKILGSRMHEFATYVSQFEKEEEKLKSQLAEAGDDIFRLVEDRDKNSKEKTERLRSQVDKLSQELTREVEKITTELNTRLEEWRAKVIDDLGKVGSLETTSDEMQAALQEALGKVETEIAEHVKKAEQEIADKTAPLRELMSRLKGINNSY